MCINLLKNELLRIAMGKYQSNNTGSKNTEKNRYVHDLVYMKPYKLHILIYSNNKKQKNDCL